MLDLLCMGDATVDLFAEQTGARLEDAFSFIKYIGSSAANIAIGVTRLGLKSGLVTRIGDDAMGRYVLKFLEKEKVDLSHVYIDTTKYTGIQLIGGSQQDQKPILYYRENSADRAIGKDDFAKSTFENAKALFVTGTCCSHLKLFENTLHAIYLAKEASCKIILDIEYREAIWKLACKENDLENERAVLERVRRLFEWCDLIIGTEEELLIATGQQTPGAAISFLREHTNALIVQKRGSEGCIAYQKDLQAPVIENQYTIEAKGSFGSGDAFVSGFLLGYLKGSSIQESCKLANANQTIVISRKRCAQAMPYWEELQFFMKNPLKTVQTEQRHSSLKRPRFSQDLCVLAFDHRPHFQKYDCSDAEIVHCKELLYQALLRAKKQKEDVRFGVLIDEVYGKKILDSIVDFEEWVGRPIEASGISPLTFLHGDEASYLLRTWPKNQVVKVLCSLEEGQIKKLHDLFLAAEQTGHHLFIGFHFAQESLPLLYQTLEACYQSSIFPAWWGIPFFTDSKKWKEIEELIWQNDPYCSGILIYDHHQMLSEFGQAYQKIKESCSFVKGCTCGRFLWEDVIEKWLRGEINDPALVEEVVNRFIQTAEALSISKQTISL